MKQKLLLVTLLFAFSGFSAAAQCFPAIDSNTIVADSTITINGGFDAIWVCPGDTLHSDGGFHNVYLEPGSVMTTGGGIDTVYVKEGATFIQNGGIDVVFYVNDTDLHFYGGIDTFPHCDTLQFNYSNAPANGCIPTNIAGVSEENSSPSVYPNPVISVSYLRMKNQKVESVQFFNSLGVIVKTISHPRQNNLPLLKKDFVEGMYLYRIRLQDGKLAEGKFVVE